MSFKIGLRLVCGFASMIALTACQGIFPGDEDDSLGAMRLGQSAPVASSQRVDEDGYPLLGAYPGTAAPQLTDEAVASTEAEFNTMANARAAGRTDSTGVYASNIQRSQAARQRQAAALEAASASQPAASGTTGRGPRPEDVLRQIEASGQQTN